METPTNKLTAQIIIIAAVLAAGVLVLWHLQGRYERPSISTFMSVKHDVPVRLTRDPGRDDHWQLLLKGSDIAHLSMTTRDTGIYQFTVEHSSDARLPRASVFTLEGGAGSFHGVLICSSCIQPHLGNFLPLTWLPGE